jgi:hypothetical protein
MNDTKPEKPEEHTVPLSVEDPRSMQATILKVANGYTVSVSLKEGGRTRMSTGKAVDSYAAAETVARAFASQQTFFWHKVAVVSR